MKLEFLKTGSPDGPLMRLYEFDAEQAQRLMQTVLKLTKRRPQGVLLHGEPGIHSVGGCELTLWEGKKDRGVRALAEMRFECTLTNDGWLNVAGLIEPFCHAGSRGYQWLVHVGRIGLLLSHDGCW